MRQERGGREHSDKKKMHGPLRCNKREGPIYSSQTHRRRHTYTTHTLPASCSPLLLLFCFSFLVYYPKSEGLSRANVIKAYIPLGPILSSPPPSPMYKITHPLSIIVFEHRHAAMEKKKAKKDWEKQGDGEKSMHPCRHSRLADMYTHNTTHTHSPPSPPRPSDSSTVFFFPALFSFFNPFSLAALAFGFAQQPSSY